MQPVSANSSSFRNGALFGMLVSLTLWATVFGGADSGPLNQLLRTPGLDKVGHVVLYGGLTALAIAGTGDRRVLRFVPLWPSVFFTLSLLDEFRQRTVPGRDFSRDDMIANLLGVSLGWVAGRIWQRLERRAG
jgi:VanZ family protein